MLNKVSLVGISNAECRKSYGKKILDSIICVKNHGTGAGTCQGDSGGGLLKRVDDGEGGGARTASQSVFVQIGIVSFGPDKGCGGEHPTGYSRISHYLDFIEEHSGIKME